MKKIIILLVLMTNIFAYEKGDIIPKSMVNQLGLNGDKVYIIDFFASWCGSCKKEIPLVSAVNLKLNKNRNMIIGIDVDKDVNKGKKFQESLREKGALNFKVINDPQNLIIAEFNPIGMPTVYYVKNRKVIGIITGAVDNIGEKILADLEAFRK